MDDGSQLLWIVIFVFFCFAAYFAVAETAFASVSKVRVKAASECGSKRAKKALFVLENFDRAVTTILIGTNITHLGIASIVTVLVVRKWGASLVTASTLVTTIAVFFFGEMLPKSIAKRYSETLSYMTAGSLLFFMKIFRPISFILTRIGQTAAKKFGQPDEVSVTEEELHNIIEDMAEDNMLGEGQSELISSALDFGDVKVSSILTSISDIDMLSVDAMPAMVSGFLLAHQHSRYPVFDRTQDHIVGTLRMRRFLKAYRKHEVIDLRSIIDPPLFISCDSSVSDLLHEMNRQKVSLAIVLNDTGKACGMTTVEDALEALVGSVWGGEPL